jgi:hypothetical protein
MSSTLPSGAKKICERPVALSFSAAYQVRSFRRKIGRMM